MLADYQEQTVMLSAIELSPYTASFVDRIHMWSEKLKLVSRVHEAWMALTRSWRYLSPIFGTTSLTDEGEAGRQRSSNGGIGGVGEELVQETKTFQEVDADYQELLSLATESPMPAMTVAATGSSSGQQAGRGGEIGRKKLVIHVWDDAKLLARIEKRQRQADEVQHSLDDYFDGKRALFPRLYFVSNDELLHIVTGSSSVKDTQQHLLKLFSGIDRLQLQPGTGDLITGIGDSSEMMQLVTPLDARGRSAEDWLVELLLKMQEAVRHELGQAINDYSVTQHQVVNSPSHLPQEAGVSWQVGWAEKWCGSTVLLSQQAHFAQAVEGALGGGGDAEEAKNDTGKLKHLLKQKALELRQYAIAFRGKMAKSLRTKLGAACTLGVHNRDLMVELLSTNVCRCDRKQ
jgi:dynein heavy chain